MKIKKTGQYRINPEEVEIEFDDSVGYTFTRPALEIIAQIASPLVTGTQAECDEWWYKLCDGTALKKEPKYHVVQCYGPFKWGISDGLITHATAASKNRAQEYCDYLNSKEDSE